jgi:hypothetical protein
MRDRGEERMGLWGHGQLPPIAPDAMRSTPMHDKLRLVRLVRLVRHAEYTQSPASRSYAIQVGRYSKIDRHPGVYPCRGVTMTR